MPDEKQPGKIHFEKLKKLVGPHDPKFDWKFEQADPFAEAPLPIPGPPPPGGAPAPPPKMKHADFLKMEQLKQLQQQWQHAGGQVFHAAKIHLNMDAGLAVQAQAMQPVHPPLKGPAKFGADPGQIIGAAALCLVCGQRYGQHHGWGCPIDGPQFVVQPAMPEGLHGPAKFGLPPGTVHGAEGMKCLMCGNDWIQHDGWDCPGALGVKPMFDDPFPPEDPDVDFLDEEVEGNVPVIAKPGPGKGGPHFIASKKETGGSRTSCQTCGDYYTKLFKSADGLLLCPRCKTNYQSCGFCGWKPKDEEFKAMIFTHLYCPECGPQRKSKLNVKQKKAFDAKSDVLGTRRRTTWNQTRS